MKLYTIIPILLLNLISYITFGIDKRKARRNQWRISEKNLILLSLIAPLGAFIGMRIFHHKTKKLKFKILIPLFLLIQIGAILYIFWILNPQLFAK